MNKPHSILGRAVCLSLHPGRLIIAPFAHWFHTHYKGKYKFERGVFTFDLVLIGAVLTLGLVALWLFLFPLHSFEDDILFEATVAPREIMTGAPSTLIIRYTNGTKEPLRHTKLSLTFPDHFLLQGVSSRGKNVEEKNIDIGDIAVGESGDVRIRGVMFGDVHGKQVFQSSMTFIHGVEKDVAGKKISSHTFSPVRSTLALSLELPKRVMASQPLSGTITYKNMSMIDFPEILIEPEWPKGFTPSETLPFRAPQIKAGQTGTIPFHGYLGDVPKQVDFVFHPSFVFGNDRYRQETLRASIPVFPAQLNISHTLDQKNLRPGSEATATIFVKHVGTETLENLEIGLSSDNPFIGKMKTENMKTLKPGEEKTFTVSVPILSHVVATQLTSFEQIQIHSHAFVHYTLESAREERVTTVGNDLISNLVTPITFESFARYAMPSGDQIGRGPLPPRVGQKTSYWIFWHVDGTTNPIGHVSIEGTLPTNVTFTGKETASENGGVAFDPETRKISWNVSSIPPTLNSTSKVYSVAFEVVIIPTASQVGTSPILMQDIHLTATDTFTNEFVTATSGSISTNLPNDVMAAKKGIVR